MIKQKPLRLLALAIAPLLVVALLSTFVGPKASAAPLTSQQQKQCTSTWDNGKAYYLNKPADVKVLDHFKTTNCYSGNNGNCHIDAHHNEITDTGQRVSYDLIFCNNQLGDPAPQPQSTGSTAESCANGTTDPALCTPDCQGSSDCNLTEKYLNPLINNFLAPLAILAVVIGMVWGGIEYTTSGGDAQKAANAKGRIQKALIGLLGFMFLYAFLQWLIPGGKL